MNIVFTAAGRGTRFLGHSKPLFVVNGKSLLEWSLGSLGLEGSYWLITNQDRSDEENVAVWKVLSNLPMPINEIKVLGHAGQAAHALKLATLLDQDESLLIVNIDQYTPWDSEKFQKFLDNTDFDGIVTTYEHGDFELGKPSKYSHIRFEGGRAVELAEKLAISEHSLNGIFYFRKCSDFVEGAKKLILDTKSGETYMSLVYNYMIADGKKIGIYTMAPEEFVSLGSLEEVQKNLDKLP